MSDAKHKSEAADAHLNAYGSSNPAPTVINRKPKRKVSITGVGGSINTPKGGGVAGGGRVEYTHELPGNRSVKMDATGGGATGYGFNINRVGAEYQTKNNNFRVELGTETDHKNNKKRGAMFTVTKKF